MKRWAWVAFAVALILALFDGASTYFAVSRGLASEANPIHVFLQGKYGLEAWWLIHLFLCLGAVAILGFLVKRGFWWVAYIWLGAEILVCINHAVGLLL